MVQKVTGLKSIIGAVQQVRRQRLLLRVPLPFSPKGLLSAADIHAGITHNFTATIYSIPYYIIPEAKQAFRTDVWESMHPMDV